MIILTNKSQCCGCAACVQVCPKQCISMKEDEEGFLYPQVDESSCVDCGLCESVCPMNKEQTPIKPQSVCAVKNPNDEERLKSSSGGVFIMLAKYILELHGVVFGAVFDDNWEVKHVFAEKKEDVYPMMRSKYLQSRIENTYKEVKSFLLNGRLVLFVGTSCQIKGLKSYLRKEYDNLLAVDFLCHGVPSPGVWRSYLSEIKESLSARSAADGKNTVLSSLKSMSDLSGINFREKNGYGWKKYGFAVEGKSAFKAENSVLLSSTFSENPFMKGFLADIYLRPSCYTCLFKNGRSGSDLTIGDYWGVNIVDPAFDDDKGVGIVLVNTKKGQSFYSKLNVVDKAASLTDIISYNGGFKDFVQEPDNRSLFFRRWQMRKETVSSILLDILPIQRKLSVWDKILSFCIRLKKHKFTLL